MTEEEFEKLKPGDKVTLLPWEEARKAVRGTLYDCDGSIYSMSEPTWEMIRRTNEFIDRADDREFNKLYKFIGVKGAGFTWHIPKCCVVGKKEEKRIAGMNDIIEIFARNNKTIAKRGGKVGIARRSPQDKHDEAKGIIIAVARLYGYDVVTDGESEIELAGKEKIDADTKTFFRNLCLIGKQPLPATKDRVIRELAELEEKTEKLSHALAPLADKIGADTEAYNLLNRQLDVMRMYAEILKRRLAIWKD